MGCAVGTANAGRVRDVQQQVLDLQERLDESERERQELRQKLDAAQREAPANGDHAPARAAAQPSSQSQAAVALSTEDENCLEAQQSTVDQCAADGAPQTLSQESRTSDEEKPLLSEAAPTGQLLGPLPGEVADEEPQQQDTVAAQSPPVQQQSIVVPPSEAVERAGIAATSKQTSDAVEEANAARNNSPGVAKEEEVVPTDGAQEAPRESPTIEDVATAALQEETDASSGSPAGMPNSVDSYASTCAPGTQQEQALLVCHECAREYAELFLDPTDMHQYCECCWMKYYGSAPTRCELKPLVPVVVAEVWNDDRLAQSWAELPIPGWPPRQLKPSQMWPPPAEPEGEIWSNVAVRIRRNIVGSHAREQSQLDRPVPGEILASRYHCKSVVGEGHFTKAFLAVDASRCVSVCLKRHRNLTVENLADLMVIGRRLQVVDAGGLHFPCLVDAFFDIVGYTVESLLEGSNCLAMASADPDFFLDLGNLQHVARGALEGLKLLDSAGIVHNDVKPDNLMWSDVHVPSAEAEPGSTEPVRRPHVRIVDFGCARLDQREEPGRNWSLAEGGAGHLGKWSPEMTLRLPIGHRGDVWGLAISICELHCARCVWRSEADTAEIVMAQTLGLCDLREGIPTTLMRRSPLDIRQLYTPAPSHWPLRRNAAGQLEALQPATWGLEQVLGNNWRDAGKCELHEFLQAALVVDPLNRPSACELLESCSFVKLPDVVESDQPVQS